MDLTDEVDKQLYGTTWVNTVAYKAMFARDRVHFPDDKSLERAENAIIKAIELKNTTAEIIALLKEEQAANDIVLKDNQERYTRYLKGRTHTLELEQADGNVKWFYGLASRHKDYKDFLDTQLKRFTPAPAQTEQADTKTPTIQPIYPTGKPWESEYNIVVSLCDGFGEHFSDLVDKGYITIKEDSKTLSWEFNMATKKDFAKYFKAIKKGGKGEQFWRHIVLLFGLAPSTDNDKIGSVIKTLTDYASNKKYDKSDRLDILFSLVGLKSGK